jgi:hypothetical protein
MGDDRVASAIARLDHALARLETASSRRPALTLFENKEAAELNARHRKLRGSVEGAIARIDSLLHAAERR